MKYLTNSGLSYFLNKIKAYLTSSTYLNSIGIFPNTDNSVDLGDSSKNIKMIYTEGITINGTQLSSNGITVDSTLDATSSNAVSNSVVSNALDGKSDVGHTHTVSDVTDFPTLATVATSGSYNDLSNKPTTMTPTSHTHGNITNDGKIGSNANKPLITTTGGTVTTGSFGTTANTFCEGNDSRLSDARTPTSHTHTKSEITDFPSLSTVATSGSYNDLSNKPTIPTVNNATLTIQKNGTTVKTFTANASSNVTANITVPTKTSDLTNDSGFLTSHQSLSNYSTLANTIKSLSISGKTITYTKGDNSTGTLTTQDNNTWTAMVGATSSSNGSVGYVNAVPPKDGYNTKYLRADGTWQVPPDHTYTVNNATLTIQKNGSNVATFTSNASSNVTCNITVPTKTSQLTNDSKFLTSEIDSSGPDWVRFKSGVQICWGTYVSQTQQTSVTFGKAFLGLVSYGIGVCPSDNVNCWISARSATGIALSTEMGDGNYRRVDWLAIGRWK